MSLWLLGTGTHALEYAKVLKCFGRTFDVVGRGRDSAKNFERSSGVPVMNGILSEVLGRIAAPMQAIVAVSYDQLFPVAESLVSAGTRYILLEKPGALSTEDARNLSVLADRHCAQIWVAYNRRYYSSTMLARRLIRDDGGVTSCTFEFTEWPHTIVPMKLPKVTEEAWVIANSSHVVDLAFHLCGVPDDWSAWKGGATCWHSAAARFCGAGRTNQGVFFSYHADWEAPGRWGLEVLTRRRRLIFKPLEALHCIANGTTAIEALPLENTLDQMFKPGLYRQTEAFLAGDTDFLCSIKEQVSMMEIYSEIAGYA